MTQNAKIKILAVVVVTVLVVLALWYSKESAEEETLGSDCPVCDKCQITMEKMISDNPGSYIVIPNIDDFTIKIKDTDDEYTVEEIKTRYK